MARRPEHPPEDPQAEISKLRLEPADQQVVDSIVGRESARTRFYRTLTIVFGLVGVALAVLAIVSLSFAVSAKSDAHATNQTVQKVTNPKTQLRQYSAFLGVESVLFQSDCRAKAAMLNLQTPAIPTAAFAAHCADIQPPPVPPALAQAGR